MVSNVSPGWAAFIQASSAMTATVAPLAMAMSCDMAAKSSLAFTSARFLGTNITCLPSPSIRNKVGGKFPVPRIQYSA